MRFDREWTERARGKIRAKQILNRLQNHVLKGDEMAPSQIQAAALLLKKCLPDLTEHKEEVSNTLTIRLDPYAGAATRLASKLEGQVIPGQSVVCITDGDEAGGMRLAQESGEGLDEPELDGVRLPAESRLVLAPGAGSEASEKDSVGRDRQGRSTND